MLAYAECLTDYTCEVKYKISQLPYHNVYEYCSGDSGSPLLGYNKKTGTYKVIGIFSGDSHSDKGVGTFSLFSKNRDWINSHLEKLKNNTLSHYDSRLDQNLNIPFPEGINTTSVNVLHKPTKIHLYNSYGDGSGSWYSFKLALLSNTWGVDHALACGAMNGYSRVSSTCTLSVPAGTGILNALVIVPEPLPGFNRTFNISEMNKLDSDITITAKNTYDYGQRRWQLTYEVEPVV